MTADQMRSSYNRRRTAMLGWERMRVWSLTQVAIPSEARPGKAFAFFHSCEESARGHRLPEQASSGMTSAHVRGGLDVVLLSYIGFSNLPHCVSQIDARRFLSEEAFRQLLDAKIVDIKAIGLYICLAAMEESTCPLNLHMDCGCLFVKRAMP